MPQAARQPSAGVKTLVMMLIKALKGFIFSWGASPPPSAAVPSSFTAPPGVMWPTAHTAS